MAPRIVAGRGGRSSSFRKRAARPSGGARRRWARRVAALGGLGAEAYIRAIVRIATLHRAVPGALLLALGACAGAPPSRAAGAGVELRAPDGVRRVGARVVLVARVRDARGLPVADCPVVWSVGTDGVGRLLAVGGAGGQTQAGDAPPGATRTSATAYAFDLGAEGVDDDVQVAPGETWCVVRADAEGAAYVAVDVPEIADSVARGAFARVAFRAVAAELPPDATVPLLAAHTLATRVVHEPDGAPRAGYVVTYDVVGGPDAHMGGARSRTVTTGADGVATATVAQASPAVGTCDVAVTVTRPAALAPSGVDETVRSGLVHVTWRAAPAVSVRCVVPARATAGEPIDVACTVRNDGDGPADDVVATQSLEGAAVFVAASDEGALRDGVVEWRIGTLGPGEERRLHAFWRPTAAGTLRAVLRAHAAGAPETAAESVGTVAPAQRPEDAR